MSGWESPISVSTVGDSIVSTEGDLVVAKNLGQASAKTVNGVTFSGVVSDGDFPTGVFLSTFYADGGVGVDFEAMMQSFSYGSGTRTITLSGLISGREYLLQVFDSDDRAAYGPRTVQHYLAGYTSAATAHNTSFSAICRFVATDVSTPFSMVNSIGDVSCNGYQLRLLPLSGNPTTNLQNNLQSMRFGL